MQFEPGSDRRLTRRYLLYGLASIAALRSPLASAQQMQTYMPPGVAPRAKGRLVFLDYDHDELDASYEQALWAPNQAEIRKRNAQKTAAAD